MIRLMSEVVEWKYRRILKPLLFMIPPDEIHERGLSVARFIADVPGMKRIFSTFFRYDNVILEQTVLGTHFANPVGLAAGYDYRAYMTGLSAALGFGWQSIGSVTNGAYAGNTPPMYGRLPNTQSLWVNKGFKNEGAEHITQRLMETAATPQLPLGISIGATNQPYETLDAVLKEYEAAFRSAQKYAAVSYYELNISCPNLQSKYSLYEPKSLERLLVVTDSLDLAAPLLVKMPVDITVRRLHELLDVMAKRNVAGIIIGNLTKNKATRAIWRSEVQNFPDFGGYSGKAVQALSDTLIAAAYKHAGDRFVIVGTGGIFTGADAYRKIRNGATLVQLVTGMIYRGPQAIGQINRELAELLRRDGFTSISEAIGVDAQ